MEEPPPPPPSPPSTSLFRHVINFDTSVSLTIHNFTQPILPRSFLKLLEISGDGRLFFPILLSLLLSPLPSTSPLLRSLLINFLSGSLLDLLLIGLIKHLVRRPRPVYNKNMFLTFAVDHWSFPSGHASRVCFTAALFYLSSDLIPDIFLQLKSDVLGLDEFESVKRLNLIVIAWATVTSVSRVLLGRHFVFDVAAGAGLGVLNASFVFHFLNCSKRSARCSLYLCSENPLLQITWAEGDSEEEKFGLTHLKEKCRNLNKKKIGELKETDQH